MKAKASVKTFPSSFHKSSVAAAALTTSKALKLPAAFIAALVTISQ
jgi:hypothetical protein